MLPRACEAYLFGLLIQHFNTGVVAMISEERALEIMREAGAIITDSHIVYTSGKHGSAYVNKDALYANPKTISRLCQSIAADRALFLDSDIDTVIGPAIGGVILAQWIAHYLARPFKHDIMSVYAEKSPDTNEFVIGRGYDKFITGKNVLIVEDILNTGGSVRGVVEAVRRINGNIVSVSALCNRGNVTKEDIGNPPSLFALANIQMDAWDEAECPLCAQKVPINTDVGKGREFLARHGDYAS